MRILRSIWKIIAIQLIAISFAWAVTGIMEKWANRFLSWSTEQLDNLDDLDEVP